MKKFLFIFLAALLVLGVTTQVRAEQSASSFDGKNYFGNQVFTISYNNSGSTISSNSVVIYDSTATAGTTLGAYITATTTIGSPLVIGVTDEDIADGSSGRVCIRGAHKVLIDTVNGNAPTLGASVATATVSGKGILGVNIPTSRRGIANNVGQVLSVTATTADTRYPALYWIDVEPQSQIGRD